MNILFQYIKQDKRYPYHLITNDKIDVIKINNILKTEFGGLDHKWSFSKKSMEYEIFEGSDNLTKITYDWGFRDKSSAIQSIETFLLYGDKSEI